MRYDARMLIEALLFAHLVVRSSPRPSSEEVLALMSELPAVEGNSDSHKIRFDLKRDAKEISVAIADVVADWYEAQIMVVYAAYESGNVKDAVGDHGLSFGAWQMRGLNRDCAFVPKCAAPVWLLRARQANIDCGENEFEERLAPLASGNCDHARQKTRWRVELAERL